MNILRRFPGLRVLVVGDVMLDEYLHGTVRRVSPEAPVPVVERTGTTHVPGGAANVAVNIAGLGAMPLLVGIVGEDGHAGALKSALQKHGIATDCLVSEAGRPTTTKTRVIASRHQIVRIDEESSLPVGRRQADALLEQVDRRMDTVDACVLSDYGKGVLSTSLCALAISRAIAAGKPVIVDPKTRDLAMYRDATVITPNLKEFRIAAGEQITNDASLSEAAKRLSGQIGNTALLVTKGSRGMTLLEAGREPRHAKALARQVFDVTGAGDTVVSTLALALAAGASLADAAYLSNIAAGIVVTKPGTAWISLEELMEAAAREQGDRWHPENGSGDYEAADE